MNLWILLGVCGALGAFALLIEFAYSICALLFPTDAVRARFCGTVVTAYWTQGVIFYGFLYSGSLTRMSSLAALIAFGVIRSSIQWTHGNRIAAARRCDVESLGMLWEALTESWIRYVAGASALLVASQVFRSLIAPPMAWDDLTYHLVRSTLWVQHAGVADYTAPGAWEYYRYFLPLGESLPTWGLLFVGNDLVVPLVGFAIWGCLLGAIYCIARELEASRMDAALSALALALVPAVASHTFTAYVDNHTALLQVVSLALLANHPSDTRLPTGELALIGLGTAVAIKQTAVPSVAFGSALYLYFSLRSENSWRYSRFGIAIIMVLAITLPPFVYNYVETGSPTYPFALTLQGQTLFHGSEEFQWLNETIADLRSRSGYLISTFWGGYHGNILLHRNFGPGVLAIVFGTVIAGPNLIRRRTTNRFPMLYAAWGLVLIGLLVALFTGTGWNQARYFAAGPILCAASISTLGRRWVRVLIVGAWATNMILFLPFNWSLPDAVGTGLITALVIPFVGLAWLGQRAIKSMFAFHRTRLLVGALASILFFSLFAAVCITPIRHGFRYPIYSEAASGNSFSNIPVTGNHGLPMASSSLWKQTDKPGTRFRIAVTAGWDGKGHNWFVYPFFGRYLQNDLVYVPITDTGERISGRHRQKVQESANFSRWVKRLREKEVDYIAALAPTTVEARWMVEHEKYFEHVQTGGHQANLLFKFQPSPED
jgi:hypothetical protein